MTFAKIPLLFRVASLYFVVALISLFLTIKPMQLGPKALPELVQAPTVSKVVIDGEPKTFIMERFGIKLPIKPGIYDNLTDSWTLSDDAVYFAVMSEKPNNQSGVTFIYGHNNDQVIGKMKDVAVGDIVSIETINSHKFTYVYSRDAIIPPNMTKVLYDKSPTPQLVIMTCEGIWSQARRLMYFNLNEAS